MTDDTFPTRPASPGGPDSAGLSMRHPDQETLGAFLDGAISTGEGTLVAAHLRGCADCRREVAAIRATVALLDGLPQYEPRRSFRLAPQQAGRARTVSGGWLPRLLPSFASLRIATAAVAMLLVVVSAGDILSHRDQASDRSSPQSASETVATVPALTKVDNQPVLDLEQAPSSASGAPGAFSAPAAAPAEDAAGAVVVTTSPSSAATLVPARQPAPAPADEVKQDNGPTFWRLSEVALALVLAWLLVSLTGLQQMRWRRR